MNQITDKKPSFFRGTFPTLYHFWNRAMSYKLGLFIKAILSLHYHPQIVTAMDPWFILIHKKQRIPGSWSRSQASPWAQPHSHPMAPLWLWALLEQTRSRQICPPPSSPLEAHGLPPLPHIWVTTTGQTQCRYFIGTTTISCNDYEK